MRTEDVAINFLGGAKNGKANSVFIDTAGENTVLYSYGYHFPMALRYPNGGLMINSDKYSVTTSKHQSYLRRHISSEIIEPVTTEELKNLIRGS